MIVKLLSKRYVNDALRQRKGHDTYQLRNITNTSQVHVERILQTIPHILLAIRDKFFALEMPCDLPDFRKSVVKLFFERNYNYQRNLFIYRPSPFTARITAVKFFPYTMAKP